MTANVHLRIWPPPRDNFGDYTLLPGTGDYNHNYHQLFSGIFAGPTHVTPGEFFGMHFHHWPKRMSFDVNPLVGPKYRPQIWRSMDMTSSFWFNLMSSAGVFNQPRVDNLDAFFDAAERHNAKVLFTLFGTPSFYTTRDTRDAYGNRIPNAGYGDLAGYQAALAANPGPLPEIYGAYGVSFAPGSPTAINLQPWIDFVTWVVNRYGHRIWKFELWNEPSFVSQVGGPGYYFDDTAESLAAMSGAAHTIIKAAFPNTDVCTPGFSGNLVRASEWLNACETLLGYIPADIFARHAYEPNTLLHSGAPYNPDDGSGGALIIDPGVGGGGNNATIYADVHNCYTVYGPEMLNRTPGHTHFLTRMAITETGFEDSVSFSNTERYRARYLWQMANLWAVLGVEFVCFYSGDIELGPPDPGYSAYLGHDGWLGYAGYPVRDPLVSKMYRTISHMHFREINGIYLLTDDSTLVTYTDGTFENPC